MKTRAEREEKINFLKKILQKVLSDFGSFRKCITFALAIGKTVVRYAEIAQLVEHNLAKVRVASSSLVFRSFFERMLEWWNR